MYFTKNNIDRWIEMITEKSCMKILYLKFNMFISWNLIKFLRILFMGIVRWKWHFSGISRKMCLVNYYNWVRIFLIFLEIFKICDWYILCLPKITYLSIYTNKALTTFFSVLLTLVHRRSSVMLTPVQL